MKGWGVDPLPVVVVSLSSPRKTRERVGRHQISCSFVVAPTCLFFPPFLPHPRTNED